MPVQRIGIGQCRSLVEPGLDLPDDCQPVPRLITAEAQCADVPTDIGLEAFEVADREVSYRENGLRILLPEEDHSPCRFPNVRIRS